MIAVSLILYFLDVPTGKDYELAFARKTAGASGFDLQANIGEARIIEPMRRFTVKTGLSIAMPLGVEAHVRPRSGLSRDHGVMAMFGSIDSDYRGEIAVTMINLGHEPYKIIPGDRIAQLVFAPVMVPGEEHVPIWHYDRTHGTCAHPGLLRVTTKEALGDTQRGASGFGSTGR